MSPELEKMRRECDRLKIDISYACKMGRSTLTLALMVEFEQVQTEIEILEQLTQESEE